MNPPLNLLHIRELLRTKFPLAQAALQEAEAVPTGVDCLDQLQLQPGRLHEIVCGSRGAGAGLLLSALLDAWGRGMRTPVALVDGADVFSPQEVAAETRERLLWLRCRSVEQAVKGADLLLRDGNISRVLMDVGLCPVGSVRKVPAQAWHRLRLLAEKSGSLCCIFTAFQTVPCARSRLLMQLPHGLDAMDRPRPELLARLRGGVVRRSAGVESEMEAARAALNLAEAA
ncbi:hypothetical protein [Prosthecobacter sp.]|uniref:hypothetical protein n=1 Tax=Prosthecobacter sp. TaxID=1965333 RepID=UPI003784A488